MELSVSLALWQHFNDKNLNTSIIWRDKKSSWMMLWVYQEWTNLLHKCQIFRDHLTYMGLTFMLKDGKP